MALIYAQEVLRGRPGQKPAGAQEPRAHGPISIVSDLKNVTKRMQHKLCPLAKS